MAIPASKLAAINQLKKDLLVLQGFKMASKRNDIDTGLGVILKSFPESVFPLGAIHEFVVSDPESRSATMGFMSGILSALAKNNRVILWISPPGTVFPPSLIQFNLDPERIIFVTPQRKKDLVWVIEEGLKCDGLAAVVGELNDLNFTESRRLQLAVEQSRVTGFIIRKTKQSPQPNACIARWQIHSLPSQPEAGLPGIGHPRWQVELLKIRNGQPGNWELEWHAGRFRHVQPSIPAIAARTEFLQTG
jgi:protein ImuA